MVEERRECRDQFVIGFIGKVGEKVTHEDLRIVHRELIDYIGNFDVYERETALALFEDLVPPCYEAFIAIKKIAGRSDGTLLMYHYHLIDFFYNIGVPFEKITETDVYKYLWGFEKRRNVGKRSVEHVRLIVHGFLQWCSDNGYLERNPCKNISRIKFEEKPRKPLTADELEMVRDACETVYEKALVEVLYSTGARVSELCGLKRSDVDMNRREVTVFGKGAKYRTVYLSPRAYITLNKYLASRKDECNALFVTTKRPYTAYKDSTIRSQLIKIGKRAGLDRQLHPHLLRHTLATNLLQRGVELERIQRLLGHEKADTTLIYARINTDDIRNDVMRYA